MPGGISYREAHLAMEIIADHGGMAAMDIVEVIFFQSLLGFFPQ